MHEVMPSAEKAAAAAAKRAFSILPHVSFFMVIAFFIESPAGFAPHGRQTAPRLSFRHSILRGYYSA